MESPEHEICGRIAQLRTEMAGSRGKSFFAKQLGLSPSTYDYYESTRVPPADILLRIADIAGVDLRWLITGQASATAAVPADHPVLQRAAAMLAKFPNSAKPLAAFLDVLSASLQFPQKTAAPDAQPTPAATAQPAPSARANPKASWIPILGRSAAGVAHFWSTDDEAQGLTTLDQLIERHADAGSRQESSATSIDGGRDEPVQIVTLRQPDENDLVEFVVSAGLKSQYPDAFAVRIDGDSMTPDIRHGDLVILSPSNAARDGRAAVVQLRRQIGVTCKIYRCQGGQVFLVPVNDTYPTLTAEPDQVAWALRVLARIQMKWPVTGSR